MSSWSASVDRNIPSCRERGRENAKRDVRKLTASGVLLGGVDRHDCSVVCEEWSFVASLNLSVEVRVDLGKCGKSWASVVG